MKEILKDLKLNFKMQLKESQQLSKVSDTGGPFGEKQKLRNIIEDKNHQVDNLKGECETLKDQLAFYRRDVSFIL